MTKEFINRAFKLLAILLLVYFSVSCSDQNPFLPKISQKGIPAFYLNNGFVQLRYSGNRTTVKATLSKSDLLRLVPKETYGGDLTGNFGSPSKYDPSDTSIITDPDGDGFHNPIEGTGTFMNSNFTFVEQKNLTTGSCYTPTSLGGGNDVNCKCEGKDAKDLTADQCILSPLGDSIYLLNFELTKKGGVLENSLKFIREQYGTKICTAYNDSCTSEEKLGAMLAMTPNTLPIYNIPTLGTIFYILESAMALFGLDGALNDLVRGGIALIYGIGRNDYVVSPGFVQEAAVRDIMYCTDPATCKVEDLNNAGKTIILCEENSAFGGGMHCDNPGGLRKGPLGNQLLTADPPTQLGDPGPGRRNDKDYVGTRLALPIFMGDALSDMQTLYTGTFQTWLDFRLGNVSNLTGRYSYMKVNVVGNKIMNSDQSAELKTVIMKNESSAIPDPDANEFFQRLPVTINGTAYDGYDFSKAAYAGEDSLTEDSILLWVSDRGAYFGGCLPNANGVYWGGPKGKGKNYNQADPSDNPGCYDPDLPQLTPTTGKDNEFDGAGMFMDNMNDSPLLNLDMLMRGDQVDKNIHRAITYQYKDKTVCIGFDIFSYCDFGVEIDMESFTGDLIQYFYDPGKDLTFIMKDINIGLTANELSAATKQTFNGYLYGDQSLPIVDPGDFQSVNPNFDTSVTGKPSSNNWFCDPLQVGYPGSCGDFRPNTHKNTASERLWKARAQKPLRKISDTLFNNSSGAPNLYLVQLQLRQTRDCIKQKKDVFNNTAVLVYKDQGGVGINPGFFLDPEMTQSISGYCLDPTPGDNPSKAGNCIEIGMIPGKNGNLAPGDAHGVLGGYPGVGCDDNIDRMNVYQNYANSNYYLIVNNFEKVVYIQVENGQKFKLTVEYIPGSGDLVRAKWEKIKSI